MNESIITYKGNVQIKYYANGKEVHYRGHNEGLNPLFKYLCMMLSKNTQLAVSEAPSYLDLRCSYLADETDDTETEVSLLYNILSVSNPTFFYDTTDYCWATKFSAVLSYSMINFEELEKHPDHTIYLYLVSQSKTSDLARLKLDENKIDITDIIPGVQALIEWTMIFQNA